ncbi:MAG: ligase-associated DNA damage response exonuclease [Pseudomonadota bacterium]
MADVLTFTDRGIYCAAGDFYVDPWRPVDRALITHGHADHARWGHKRYLCTHAAAPVIRMRLGNITMETIGFNEPRTIGGAQVSFHPAGHVPGSAQIAVTVRGETWVVSGDYKVVEDGLCEPFEPVRCHAFISECTFGLPVFTWAPQSEIMDEINGWWSDCKAQGKTAVLGAYSLGKAQRLLAGVNPDIGPILCHSAVERTNGVLRGQGYTLPDTVQMSAETSAKTHPGALIIVPPSAMEANALRRYGPVSTGYASGWMRLRGIRRRRAADRGFVVSDHADWPGLNWAIRESGCERVFVTHGYTSVFSRWLSEQGYDSGIVETEFHGDDAEDEKEDAVVEAAQA